MEVKLKISTDTLFALGKWFTQINHIRDSKGLGKVWVSIGLELSDRFEKKCKTLERQTAMFDKKKHSIKLKYYEGWAFFELLSIIIPHIKEHNPLHYSLLSKLRDEIHQKIEYVC